VVQGLQQQRGRQHQRRQQHPVISMEATRTNSIQVVRNFMTVTPFLGWERGVGASRLAIPSRKICATRIKSVPLFKSEVAFCRLRS
jgi:hypothetical protein